MTGPTEWIELRCPNVMKGRLHPEARIIEIACHQGSRSRNQPHDLDWFDADTGHRLSPIEVRWRLSGAGVIVRRFRAALRQTG